MAAENATDFQLLAEYSPDVICRVSLDMRFSYVSPSCVHVLGWTPEEMMAMPPFGLVIPEDIPALAAAAERHLAPGADPPLITIRARKKDETLLWMEVSARVVRDPETEAARETIIVMRDATERKKQEEKLFALALTDALTGLANRRAFDQALNREWKCTLRGGAQVSLLLLDLDHFKALNDLYGHQVGDDCLRAVAAAVRTAVRATDIPARYGGEELAVILPCTDTAGAIEVAEKVRSAVKALELPHEGNPEGGFRVSISVGVATALARYGGSIRMPESLLQAADTALYKAKHEGRNRLATALLMASQDFA